MIVALNGAPTAQLGPGAMEKALNESLHNDKRVLTVRSGPAPRATKPGMRFVMVPPGAHGISFKPSADGIAIVAPNAGCARCVMRDPRCRRRS